MVYECVIFYGRIDPDEQSIILLAGSIGFRGILEPIVVTLDGYILSGHRRYAAAKIAGLPASMPTIRVTGSGGLGAVMSPARLPLICIS